MWLKVSSFFSIAFVCSLSRSMALPTVISSCSVMVKSVSALVRSFVE